MSIKLTDGQKLSQYMRDEALFYLNKRFGGAEGIIKAIAAAIMGSKNLRVQLAQEVSVDFEIGDKRFEIDPRMIDYDKLAEVIVENFELNSLIIARTSRMLTQRVIDEIAKLDDEEFHVIE